MLGLGKLGGVELNYSSDIDLVVLYDEDGRAIPFTVVKKQFVERFWGIDYRAALSGEEQRERFGTYERLFADRILRGEDRKGDSDCFLTIRFEADLPALAELVSNA